MLRAISLGIGSRDAEQADSRTVTLMPPEATARVQLVWFPLGTPLATQAAVGVTAHRMVKGKTPLGDATFLAMSVLPLL